MIGIPILQDVSCRDGAADMVAITSRIVIHDLNELQRLEKNHFGRLGQSETKTVKVCGGELNALALHYKKHVGSRRVGIDRKTCKEIEDHFSNIAEAMDYLHECIQDQPTGIHHIFNTYEHGHASWSLDGYKRPADANNVIMQLWHDGHASQWFLPGPVVAVEPESGSPSVKPVPENRMDELVHLANLMRKLSTIYRGLQDHSGAQDSHQRLLYDEKDALVVNLAGLVKGKARPVLHVVDIATLIHEWATGDPIPQHARFRDAYRAWKTRS
jgi:hypothetical protein